MLSRNRHAVRYITCFSVLPDAGVPQVTEIAHGYGFCPTQSTVDELDVLSVIVDGPVGTLTVCNIDGQPSTGVVYIREGTRTVLPLSGDDALLGDATATTRVDGNGRVVASTPRTGTMATDALGNIYIARVADAALTITTHAPDLTTRAAC